MAAVEIGSKWGFIDKQGKLVVKSQFEAAEQFSEGLAAVLISGYETGKWAT